MSSHIVEIYDAIRTLFLSPAQESLGIQHVDLADQYALGPELGQRLARMGAQNGLNAVVVEPGPPEEASADAARRISRITQPFTLHYVWKRQDASGGVAMRDVIQRVDVMHERLQAESGRRLDNLRLHNAAGKDAGHVTGFTVHVPDFAPPANEALYQVGLGSAAIRVEVSYVSTRDANNQV